MFMTNKEAETKLRERVVLTGHPVALKDFCKKNKISYQKFYLYLLDNGWLTKKGPGGGYYPSDLDLSSKSNKAMTLSSKEELQEVKSLTSKHMEVVSGSGAEDPFLISEAYCHWLQSTWNQLRQFGNNESLFQFQGGIGTLKKAVHTQLNKVMETL